MPKDPSLTDEQLEREIQLVGELVLAASRSAGPLPQEEIDAVLGVESAEQAERAEPDRAESDPAQPSVSDPAESAPGARHPGKGLSL